MAELRSMLGLPPALRAKASEMAVLWVQNTILDMHEAGMDRREIANRFGYADGAGDPRVLQVVANIITRAEPAEPEAEKERAARREAEAERARVETKKALGGFETLAEADAFNAAVVAQRRRGQQGQP